MNGNRQMGVHYTDTGFPYTVTETFLDFFEGMTHAPVNYPQTGPIHDQENVYWSMNMNPYKFGLSGLESNYYYGPFVVNDNLPRMDASRRNWEYASAMINEELTTTDTQPEAAAVIGVHSIPEECSPNYQSTNSSQAVGQDNIDPDSMTYEALLDLGETVGTQCRGLSQDLINLLPTSKYKFGNLFSRKKSRERCVICQMGYKRGDRQMKLPCKHVYHSDCIPKWLGINKTCPICNNGVFGEEARD